MQLGFDISDTGSGKAGCGYFAQAMIQAMLELAPEHRYLVLSFQRIQVARFRSIPGIVFLHVALSL